MYGIRLPRPKSVDDRTVESRVGRRYHLYSDAARVRLSLCDPGLGESPSAGLEAVQHVDHRSSMTDQGCQFTGQEFTELLPAHGIQISMDGTGRRRDNVFVEESQMVSHYCQRRAVMKQTL